jgi:hypothetical protein
MEHWRESRAMDEHVASERFRVLLGAIEVLGGTEGFAQIDRRTTSKINKMI